MFDGVLPFHEEGGEGAARHVKAKNAHMKPQKEALKSIKAPTPMAPLALPAVAGLGVLPSLAFAVTIEGKKTPGVQPETHYIPTEEEERELAESRQRKEDKQLLNKLRYANTSNCR